MENKFNVLKYIVEQAVLKFNAKELYLIENDLSERCICAKFATYITEVLQDTEFDSFIVDVEYNRGVNGKEDGVKKIDNNPITVDLIVHKRGYDGVQGFINLICIDMKKSTDRRGCADDEARLQKMCSYEYRFCYSAGFMILVNMNEKRLEIKKSFKLKNYLDNSLFVGIDN